MLATRASGFHVHRFGGRWRRLEENSTISALGERRGDRLIAEVVVFYPNG